MRFEPETLRLEVSDHGDGGVATNGHVRFGTVPRGVAGMRERVSVLGGHIEAGPLAQGGYLVAAELPLDPL